MREYYPTYSWLTNPDGLAAGFWYKGAPGGSAYQAFLCGSKVDPSDWVALVIQNYSSSEYDLALYIEFPNGDLLKGAEFRIGSAGSPNEVKWVEVQVPHDVLNRSTSTITFKWFWRLVSAERPWGWGDETCSGTVVEDVPSPVAGLTVTGWFKGPPGTTYQQFECNGFAQPSDWFAASIFNSSSISYETRLFFTSSITNLERTGNVFEVRPGETKYVEVQIPNNIDDGDTLAFEWAWKQTGSFNPEELGDGVCIAIIGTETTQPPPSANPNATINSVSISENISGPFTNIVENGNIINTNLYFKVSVTNTGTESSPLRIVVSKSGQIINLSGSKSILPGQSDTIFFYVPALIIGDYTLVLQQNVNDIWTLLDTWNLHVVQCIQDGSNANGTCCSGTTRCTDNYCRTSCGGGAPPPPPPLPPPPGTCANEGEFSTNTLPCCTGLTKCSDGKCQLTCPCSGFMMGTTCIPSFALVGGGVFFMFIMMIVMMK